MKKRVGVPNSLQFLRQCPSLKRVAVLGSVLTLLLAADVRAQVVDFFNKPLPSDSLAILKNEIRQTGREVTQMDIGYGGEGVEGIQDLFVISPSLGKEKLFISTGHLSCYSAIVDLGDEYFVAHIDADNVPTTSEYETRLRDIISERIGDREIKQVYFGASSFFIEDEDAFLQQRLNFMRSLFPEDTNISFFSGPNTVYFHIDTIIARGGPDRVATTDVIVYFDEEGKLIIKVVRPDNPELFEQSFPVEEFPQMLERYRRALQGDGGQNEK